MAASTIRNSSSRQIVGLDLVRFFAALLVMLHHLGWRCWTQNYVLPMSYTWLEPVARPGFVGVEIFFVLSGLVIAYTAKSASAKSFLESRFVRLVPAAWICSTLSIVIVFALGQRTMQIGGVPFTDHLGTRWLHSMVFYPLGPWVDGSFWTLIVECGFYLQVFFLLVVRRLRWLGTWMTCIGLLSTLSVSIMYPVFVTYGPGAGKLYWYLDGVNDRMPFFFLLLRHGCLFALGVLLWSCFFDRVTWPRLLAMASMIGGAIVEIKLRAEWRYFWITPLVIWCVALAAIVLSVRYNRQMHAVLGERGALLARRLGLVTYPLYLLHQIAGYALLKTFKPYLPDFTNLLLVMALMIAAAFCVNLLLETPLQLFVRRTLFGQQRLPAAPAASAP